MQATAANVKDQSTPSTWEMHVNARMLPNMSLLTADGCGCRYPRGTVKKVRVYNFMVRSKYTITD